MGIGQNLQAFGCHTQLESGSATVGLARIWFAAHDALLPEINGANVHIDADSVMYAKLKKLDIMHSWPLEWILAHPNIVAAFGYSTSMDPHGVSIEDIEIVNGTSLLVILTGANTRDATGYLPARQLLIKIDGTGQIQGWWQLAPPLPNAGITMEAAAAAEGISRWVALAVHAGHNRLFLVSNGLYPQIFGAPLP